MESSSFNRESSKEINPLQQWWSEARLKGLWGAWGVKKE